MRQPSEAGEALELAAVLSSRVRQVSTRARRLTRQLRALRSEDAGLKLVPPPRPVQTMLVGCRSCDTDLLVVLDDPDVGAADARRFFDQHGECLTYVDLDRVRGAL
jgi:hypothetical protein